ncbi:hypothetical protein GCM10025862_19020 [Arsenicicoccus piscis]|uniref:Uncharacterized protein n=1 Tax=Arsenicicoccus piscis TaxID=673954 RepID=A0ABQ6HN91_9MICO|nr:hypothetical protein GCM10025862_19020 [Arsenicicoccus piscis]
MTVRPDPTGAPPAANDRERDSTGATGESQVGDTAGETVPEIDDAGLNPSGRPPGVGASNRVRTVCAGESLAAVKAGRALALAVGLEALDETGAAEVNRRPG